MSSLQKTALAQMDTQAFALMGRLHVILRRESGRVTDIEYMRIDPAYCKHVLTLARTIPHEAMPEICSRLSEIFFGADGLFAAQAARASLSPRTASAAESQEQASHAEAGPDETSVPAKEQTYVGRLR